MDLIGKVLTALAQNERCRGCRTTIEDDTSANTVSIELSTQGYRVKVKAVLSVPSSFPVNDDDVVAFVEGATMDLEAKIEKVRRARFAKTKARAEEAKACPS